MTEELTDIARNYKMAKNKKLGNFCSFTGLVFGVHVSRLLVPPLGGSEPGQLRPGDALTSSLPRLTETPCDQTQFNM